MADATARFLYQNLAWLSKAKFTASSVMSGRAVEWLKHQRRSKTWRSATGWSFVKGSNDVLRFDEGSDERIAYIDGEYATGALAAAAIESAMAAAGLEPDSAGASIWLKGEALQLKDGDDVASWPDSSGNARTLDTSVGTQTFHRNILNGRPAVRFEEDGYLSAAASAVQMDDLLDGSGRGSIFAVVWVDADHTSIDAVWAQADDNRGQFVDAADDAVARAYNGSQDNATKAGSYAGGWHLLVWQYDGTNVSAFADDIDDAGATTAASGAQTTLTQDFYLGSDGVNHLKGYLAELFAIPGDITEEVHRRLAYYVAQKFALTDVSTNTTAPAWTNTYTCTYSPTTFKYTLARATGAASFELPWTDAEYVGRTLGKDIGFTVSADDTGGTSYVADDVAHQSRHWVQVDLGSVLNLQAAALTNHAAGDGGTFTLEANDEPFWEDTPDFTTVLAAATRPAEIRLDFFSAQQSKRYWRVLIEDVQNETGYGEIGILFLGGYFQPVTSYRPGWQAPREHLSQIGLADHGSPTFDDRPDIKGFRLMFSPISEADRDEFETMANYLKRSRCFFVALDPQNVEDETYYVFLPQGLNTSHVDGSHLLFEADVVLAVPPE